jgi:hypothetical protein
MTEANGPVRTVTAPDGREVTYTLDRGPVTPDGAHAAPAEPVAPASAPDAKPRKGSAK